MFMATMSDHVCQSKCKFFKNFFIEKKQIIFIFFNMWFRIDEKL